MSETKTNSKFIVSTWKTKKGFKRASLKHVSINGPWTDTTKYGFIAKNARAVKKLKRLAKLLNENNVDPDDLETMNMWIDKLNGKEPK